MLKNTIYKGIGNSKINKNRNKYKYKLKILLNFKSSRSNTDKYLPVFSGSKDRKNYLQIGNFIHNMIE